MSFFQTPPQLKNQYDSDRVLLSYLKKNLPTEMLGEIEKDLKNFGNRVATDLWELSLAAENGPPVHNPYDAWGNRIDEVKVSEAWKKFDEVSASEGIVAIGFERKFGALSRVYQFAKLYLFHPSSAVYSCPLAMTDGAARVIELHGSQQMKSKAFKKLTSRDPKNFWTSGQWMTERTGGSDVSGTSTVAKLEDGKYRLHGVKWFTSATTSQMAMTLARIEGDERLSLFYLELRDEKGRLQNIQINRLKDKMGTKALPTAELTLSGTPAEIVGERGKGVKTIATLFNITRVYNACCAVGYMRRGLALAVDYSQKREAFGKKLIHHGLHAETLADLQVHFEASFHLTFQAVKLLGREELNEATLTESQTLRLLIPLAKLFTAKEGVAIASEIIESFGGAGYVEDTGLPQILRNAQVLAIWEGTTNVLSLDALRAIRKEDAALGFFQDMKERLEKIHNEKLQNLKIKTMDAIQALEMFLVEIPLLSEEDLNSNARSLSMSLAQTYAASLLLDQAEWSLRVEREEKALIVASRWIEKGLVKEFKSTAMQRAESISIISE